MRYKAFTEKFDETISAEDLMKNRPDCARTAPWGRDRIAERVKINRAFIERLHRRIQKEFSDKGIDPKDTIVSLELDNSGSQRGEPMIIMATLAHALSLAIARTGAQVEILGYTTKAWKGGQSKELWLAQGKPANPGRLNDLRHIIYKSPDTPWRAARKNLGMMFAEGIAKENVDGEAVVWARKRLLNQPRKNRSLILMSDAAPVDDTTLSVNPNDLLENHLATAITTTRKRGISVSHINTRHVLEGETQTSKTSSKNKWLKRVRHAAVITVRKKYDDRFSFDLVPQLAKMVVPGKKRLAAQPG